MPVLDLLTERRHVGALDLAVAVSGGAPRENFLPKSPRGFKFHVFAETRRIVKNWHSGERLRINEEGF